jgi:hypothetical protein
MLKPRSSDNCACATLLLSFAEKCNIILKQIHIKEIRKNMCFVCHSTLQFTSLEVRCINNNAYALLQNNSNHVMLKARHAVNAVHRHACLNNTVELLCYACWYHVILTDQGSISGTDCNRRKQVVLELSNKQHFQHVGRKSLPRGCAHKSR